MRGIRNEVLLGAQQTGDPVGHLIERGRQRALLETPFDIGACAHVALGHAAGHGFESPQWPSDLTSQEARRQQAECQHDQPNERERQFDAEHGSMHRRHALGHTNRSFGTPVVDDRDTGSENLFTERL